MAQRILTLLIDDLDGESEATETVSFELDGSQYEIDLTDAHAQSLREAVEAFISAARKVGRTGTSAPQRPGAKAAPAAPAADQASDATAVRAWAREQGMTVSDRGRVSGKVLQAYQDAY